ncbi:Tripartite tricarboxylate transporter TctA family protein [Hartmannibacter diazotrophicus]|uniref:Tripartite tricarboxylate transporter TctA family protein n=1 Tax=Hartmannibacter diazotrophicus TaxID=1482074 RepID=A0A2C9DDF1_9HYPH|nr:tripartite tricarboxylate transporter permease [Hartmannibacter diazotrophicus]SON57781.1 Tripartite tricarboxylate transporter TctA family protein [Hartmannibacter diazotrophicus]
MVETMFGALFHLLGSPHIMGLMLVGVVCGLLVGVTPGIGGKLSIAMAIPFVYGMDAVAGAVFLLTMHAVNGTSGQISSIMFGIPGDGDDAATTLDGYPLAKKGEAARALGASITASGVGGIIGAIVFAVLIPFLKPIVLQFSPAEFFLIALLGISFIAFLSSGDKIVKGLIVGFWGLMLSTVGMDPQTGTPRYAGDFLFLWDGVSLVTAVLALFAVPEMLALGARGGSISNVAAEDKDFSYRQLLSGVMEVPRHWWLVLRTSIIGAVVGMIPGLGGSAAAWLCYGHAVQTSKTPERFGHGAIEGVIAPETASNGKEGGSLLPTLFFGIPGSSGMAVLLGAFLILGIQPGAKMMTDHLDLVWTLIWALIVGNLIAVSILLVICRWIAALTFINGRYLVPFILLFITVGCFTSENQWQNLVILVLFSIIGYGFLRAGWPRAPFVIGLVLGGQAEGSLHQALQLWGWGFFLRPLSLVLIAMIVGLMAYAVYRNLRPTRRKSEYVS